MLICAYLTNLIFRHDPNLRGTRRITKRIRSFQAISGKKVQVGLSKIIGGITTQTRGTETRIGISSADKIVISKASEGLITRASAGLLQRNRLTSQDLVNSSSTMTRLTTPGFKEVAKPITRRISTTTEVAEVAKIRYT